MFKTDPLAVTAYLYRWSFRRDGASIQQGWLESDTSPWETPSRQTAGWRAAAA